MLATPGQASQFSALLPRVQDLKISFLLWGGYMFALASYCMVHQSVVSAKTPDLIGSLTWILREWGIWLLITPLALMRLRKTSGTSKSAQFKSYLHLCLQGLCLALAARCSIDQLSDQLGVASILVIYIPRYLVAMAIVLAIWHVALRPRPAKAELNNTEKKTEEKMEEKFAAPAPEVKADVLLVSKGNDECLLPVNRIQCVCAAGNYVEIFSEGQVYLMRATMKQLEERLPASTFLRIHRSHIVRIDQVERIKTQPSGNGEVHLHCGKILKISKHYRAQLHEAAAVL